MTDKIHLASIVLGALLGFGALQYSLQEPARNLDDAALDEGTSSVFGQRGGLPIHSSSLAELGELKQNYENAGEAEFVLWLGNSQLHAVNQLKPGQENVVAYLHDDLRQQGAFTVGLSFPNANFQEHLVALSVCLDLFPKPKWVLLPAVFDDTRETGLRPALEEYLVSHPPAHERLLATEVGRLLVEQATADAPTASQSDVARNETIQDLTEQHLEEWLASHISLWKSRPAMRGKVFLSAYRFRNWCFGINAQSARRKIPARYQLNLAAMTDCLELCAQENVTVLTYIAPIRNDVTAPYIPEEYSAFKTDVESLCESFPNVHFRNLESLVPNDLWGVKASTGGGAELEYDFMHFQAPGHQIFAMEIANQLNNTSEAHDR